MKEKVRITDEGIVVDTLNDAGQEIPDSRPMAPPIGFKRQEPLHMRIRAMVRHEYEVARTARELESPEEADDFLVPGDDDSDPRESRFALMPGYEWEDNYEPPADFGEMRKRLVDAGWTPPSEPARAPSGGAPATSPPEPPSPAPTAAPAPSAPVAAPKR